MGSNNTGFDNNFDIFNLFITKDVQFWPQDNKDQTITIHLPTIREFYQNKFSISYLYNLWTRSTYTLKKNFSFLESLCPDLNFYKLLQLIFFSKLSIFSEIQEMGKYLEQAMLFILPDSRIDTQEKVIYVNDTITMTEEICDYISYILKLS